MLVKYSPKVLRCHKKKNKKQPPEQRGFLRRHFLFAISLPRAVLRRLNKTLYIYRPHFFLFSLLKASLTLTAKLKICLSYELLCLRLASVFDWCFRHQEATGDSIRQVLPLSSINSFPQTSASLVITGGGGGGSGPYRRAWGGRVPSSTGEAKEPPHSQMIR